LTEIWNEEGGNPEGLEGLKTFFDSDYHKKIPVINVQCKLGALMLTDGSKLEEGDSMDISLISSVLPYCSAILVDKKMRNRIQNLKLDQIYSTKVFSLNKFNEIESFLSSIN